MVTASCPCKEQQGQRSAGRKGMTHAGVTGVRHSLAKINTGVRFAYENVTLSTKSEKHSTPRAPPKSAFLFHEKKVSGVIFL